ncbi:MAG: hypothetical protein NZ651_06735 [Candidatus Bipolaricaulota bacterium]|nr:hypothetical protein [Candidatus Bipolaricaulota bacterium]MDW8127450.1 hypothetical protein [Candidatus Bipolaricaulota bacterium]
MMRGLLIPMGVAILWVILFLITHHSSPITPFLVPRHPLPVTAFREKHGDVQAQRGRSGWGTGGFGVGRRGY